MKIIQKSINRSIGIYFNLLAYVHPRKVMVDGFNLFCTPFARKLKERHHEFLNKGKSMVIEVDGTSIQTYQWGHGSKHVILVHGWASHTYRWKPFIQNLLQNDFTVHAFDAPAHGNSGGKILNIIIYEKAIRQVVLSRPKLTYIIGHSIGGFASTYFLSRNPESSIKKAVILAAPGNVADFFNYYSKQLGLSNKTITLIADQLEQLYGNRPDYYNSASFGSKINIPSLIIHDKGDTATNPNDSKKLHENWPKSELILTNGNGHELKSEDVINSVIKYLK
jgi:pimeloyl-ACP methyl ester carboxylesterase